MNTYIGTKFENTSGHNQLRDLLTQAGHVLTDDWTIEGNVRSRGVDAMRACGGRMRKGIQDADFVVIWLYDNGGRGTHIEFGYADALGKRIFLVDPGGKFGAFTETDKSNAFYWGDEIVPVLCETVEEIARAICGHVKMFGVPVVSGSRVTAEELEQILAGESIGSTIVKAPPFEVSWKDQVETGVEIWRHGSPVDVK